MCAHVIEYFYNLFYTFEDEQILNPAEDVQLSLHVVFLQEIQKRLELSRQGWNNHKIRTEHNRTPLQTWTEGLITNIETDSTAVNNVFGEDPYRDATLDTLLANYGIAPAQLNVTAEDEDHLQSLTVIQPHINGSTQQLQAIQNTISVLPTPPTSALSQLSTVHWELLAQVVNGICSLTQSLLK
ncbi:UNVERIFIED_CONTAM: hypothetical protein FKN15_065084 [Acipenser sinensis]